MVGYFQAEITFDEYKYHICREDWSYRAIVYPNANNNGETWGLRIYQRVNGDDIYYGGKCLGAGFTLEESMSIATNYVIFTNIPTVEKW